MGLKRHNSISDPDCCGDHQNEIPANPDVDAGPFALAEAEAVLPRDAPPPYEAPRPAVAASLVASARSGRSSRGRPNDETWNLEPRTRLAANLHQAPRTCGCHRGARTSTPYENDVGYLRLAPMAVEADDEARWAAMTERNSVFCSDSGGCCCSSRGGYVCSDREGVCLSDRGGWFCSDTGGRFCATDGAFCCAGWDSEKPSAS
ncbi:hypothetical protein ACHAQA_000019 [Verticillium albo-atrum]